MIDRHRVQGESLGYVVVIAVDCMGRSLHCFRRSLYPMLCTYYSLILTCAIHLPRITLTTARGHNPPPPTVYCTLCKQSILHVHLLPLRVREDKLCRAVERARQIGGLTCDPSVLIGRDSSFCMRARVNRAQHRVCGRLTSAEDTPFLLSISAST